MSIFTRRTVLATGIALPIACSPIPSRGNEAKARSISPEDLGWTAQTGPRSTADIINKALTIARETGATYYDNAPRQIAGTIRLGGKVVMEFGALHSWRAVFDQPSQFDEIQGFDGTAYSGTGKRVFVNNTGARGSIIRGPFTLLGAKPANMSLSERRKIPAYLVAFTASEKGPASEMLIESLTVEGFGHALYQAGQRGKAEFILPYTRLNCGTAVIRFCLEPIVTLTGSNGLDDAVFTILRLSRNAGASLVRGTDLNAISFYNYGLSEREDIEPGEIRLRAGSDSAWVSGNSIESGMVLAALGGGVNGAGASIPFVARVLASDGGGLVLEDVPDTDFVGKYLINPPSLIVRNGALNSLHAYVEGIHDLAIALDRRGKLSARDLKFSGGVLGTRGGYPIAIIGDTTGIDVQLNPRTVANRNVKGVVGIFSDEANPAGQIISAGERSTGIPLVGDARPRGQRGRKFQSALREQFSDAGGRSSGD